MTRRPSIVRGREHRRWVTASAVLAVLGVVLGAVLVGGPAVRRSLRSLLVTAWHLPVDPADAPRESITDSEPPTLHWMPNADATWRWVPAGSVDLSRPADLYVLDLAATTPATVSAVHSRGAHAVCWLQAGVVRSGSPYRSLLGPAVLGTAVPDHPDERYLDIRQLDALRPYLAAQLDDCWTKGFDGVDASAVDILSAAGPAGIGFPATDVDQVAFARLVAALAHSRGLAAGLHTGAVGSSRADFVQALEPETDFAVVDRCVAAGLSCSALTAFSGHGKAVLHVEYLTDYPGATVAAPRAALDRFCPTTVPLGFSSILKDGSGANPGWSVACP